MIDKTGYSLALRDRVAETLARTDGWEWAAANFSSLSTPASDRYRRQAEAVLTVLAASGATVRDAARQAAGQTTTAEPDCPACDAGIKHTEHCPTPETHNWGCGCPTDELPAAKAREALAGYMGGRNNDPALALLLNNYHLAVAEAARAGATAPVVGQPAEAQPAEAHPPQHRWAAELHDPLADEWVPGTRYLVRERAVAHLEHARKIGATWSDGTPTQRRLVRETTTWTVEETR